MTQKKNKAIYLLDKFLKQKATDEENKQVNTWYDLYDEKDTVFDEGQKDALRDEMYRNIKQHIDTSPKQAVIKKITIRHFAQMAAILLIGLTITFLFVKISRKATSAELHIVSTKQHETRQLLLSDGTLITLGPLSEVRYDDQFKLGKRTVELVKGNAFFKVFHDAGHPFKLKIPEGIDIRVLGTSFSVSTSAKNKDLQIIVKTGRIAVEKNEQLLKILTSGDQLSYNDTLQSAILSHSVLPNRLIKFDHTTLRELTVRLEKEYDVNIELPADNKIYRLECTGSFDSNQDVTEVLQDICLLHHLTLTTQPNHENFKIRKSMDK